MAVAARAAAVPPALTWLVGDAAPETLAVIWATVDLERALGDLLSDSPGPSGAPGAGDAVADPFLGARVVLVAAPADSSDPTIALAEPSTEGRLALTLARNDEGPAGWYVRSPVAPADLPGRAAAAEVVLSRPATGPFGASVLVLGGPAAGPHLILVDPAAVPSRP